MTVGRPDDVEQAQKHSRAAVEAPGRLLVLARLVLEMLGPAVRPPVEHFRHPQVRGRTVAVAPVEQSVEGRLERERLRLVDEPATVRELDDHDRPAVPVPVADGNLEAGDVHLRFSQAELLHELVSIGAEPAEELRRRIDPELDLGSDQPSEYRVRQEEVAPPVPEVPADERPVVDVRPGLRVGQIEQQRQRPPERSEAVELGLQCLSGDARQLSQQPPLEIPVCRDGDAAADREAQEAPRETEPRAQHVPADQHGRQQQLFERHRRLRVQRRRVESHSRPGGSGDVAQDDGPGRQRSIRLGLAVCEHRRRRVRIQAVPTKSLLEPVRSLRLDRRTPPVQLWLHARRPPGRRGRRPEQALTQERRAGDERVQLEVGPRQDRIDASPSPETAIGDTKAPPGRGFRVSRRADSNRGPLHYE